MAMPPIYVINLARSAERRASIEKQMQRLGLDFNYFPAVDGKLLSSGELACVDFELAHKTCGHPITLSEVGCALSHLQIYEKMVQEQLPYCLILEDDVHLHMHFKKIVERIMEMDKTWDILFLHHGRAKSWPWKSALPEQYRLARYRSPSKNSKRTIISAAGYILSLSGAQKLLAKAYPIRMPLDYLTGFLQLTGAEAYGVEPCCMDVGLFDTTIDDRAYGQHAVVPL